MNKTECRQICTFLTNRQQLNINSDFHQAECRYDKWTTNAGNFPQALVLLSSTEKTGRNDDIFCHSNKLVEWRGVACLRINWAFTFQFRLIHPQPCVQSTIASLKSISVGCKVTGIRQKEWVNFKWGLRVNDMATGEEPLGRMCSGEGRKDQTGGTKRGLVLLCHPKPHKNLQTALEFFLTTHSVHNKWQWIP